MNEEIHILLVEDNPGDAEYLQELLAEEQTPSFSIVSAQRLADAIILLRGEPFDIILLDLGLPDSQGMETLTAVTAGSGAPVIILTGLADEDFALQAIKAGAADYLLKGQINRILIVRTIRYAIERKRTELRISHLASFPESNPMPILETDLEGRITYTNPALRQLFPDILAQGLSHPLLSRWNDVVETMRKTGQRTVSLEVEAGSMWFDQLFFYSPDSGYFRINNLDITERKRAGQALRESEERYRIITEAALDAIFTIDEESRILVVNPAEERIFGYPPAELNGKSLTMLMPERFRQSHINAVKNLVATGIRRLPWGVVELPGLHKDGREIPLEISYGEYRKNGKYFFIGVVRDISERKRAEETIRYQAYHDLLTGLPNRDQLMIRLKLELEQHERNRKKLALLHIDLDRFRTINDTLGHAIGDKVIKAVTQRLKTLANENVTLSRIGSDEFIIILPDLTKAEEAGIFAQRIVDAMRKSLRIEGRELYSTASIGMSVYPDDGDSAEAILRNADIAVSSVKDWGRNNFQFFNPALNRRTVERLLLESSLRQSLERGEIEVHYQPQINIKSGKMIAVEALSRWRHPVLGLLEPAQYIPVAEEIGFISAIDNWVLRTAAAQNRAWQDAGYPPMSMTVNISAHQFQQPTFIEMIRSILKETGLEPRYLDIEITESTAMLDIDRSVPHLKGLHELGIDLSIDDFGTGYSSLNYLKRFPVHKLKIDKSFIHGLSEDRNDQSIVRAVIAMGHNLGLTIIAEGVETKEQYDFLKESDCDEVQGFLFSHAVPAEGVRMMLAA